MGVGYRPPKGPTTGGALYTGRMRSICKLHPSNDLDALQEEQVEQLGNLLEGGKPFRPKEGTITITRGREIPYGRKESSSNQPTPSMSEKMTEIGFEKEYTMTDVAFSVPSYSQPCPPLSGDPPRKSPGTCPFRSSLTHFAFLSWLAYIAHPD